MRTTEAWEEFRNYIKKHCKTVDDVRSLNLIPILSGEHEDSYVHDDSVDILGVSVNEKGVDSITTRLWVLNDVLGYSYIDNKYTFIPEITFK